MPGPVLHAGATASCPHGSGVLSIVVASPRVSLNGTSTEGKKIRMELPMSDVEALELKGMPGHYAVGTSIPLETFKTGDYTLTVKLVDTISSKTFELKEAFKIRSEK